MYDNLSSRLRGEGVEQERMRHLDCEYFKLERPMSNLPFYRSFGECTLPSAQKCKLDGEAYARPGWCPVLDSQKIQEPLKEKQT